MSPQKVLFSGDTHGNFDQVMWLIKRAKKEGADAIFVLGDFGIWDHLDDGKFTDLCSRDAKRSGVSVYFLPGNHENYDLLEQYERECPRDDDGFVILKEGVLYSPRAHRWTWNGVRFLSLGGAYSVDKYWRVQSDEGEIRHAMMRESMGRVLTRRHRYALAKGQMSWWHQEEITETERDRAMEGGEVDVMLTHDKPRESRPEWNRKDLDECWPNQQKIQDVVEKTQPALLLHGHLHFPYGQTLASTGTVVRAFDCDPDASDEGDRTLSYGAMTFLGEGERGYTLEWHRPRMKDDGRLYGAELEQLTHRFRPVED